MKLSILDFGDVGAAADLLVEADRLGYERYWLGEHHTRWQCANPMLLGALLAAISGGIRVGSGGVCLDYHSPYRIAEDARLIEFVLPGRFDLGVTRGLTLRPELSAALLDGCVADRRDQHPARLAELHGCLTGRLPADHPLYRQDLHLEAGPPMWVLGVSEDTARWAGRHGTGFCFSLHHAPGGRDGRVVVDEYRRAFVPSPEFAEPAAIVMVSLLWEADPPAERRSTNVLIVGSAAEAAAGLMATARHCGVEEIMALVLGVPGRAGLIARYRALAGEVGMARRDAVPSATRPVLGGSVEQVPAVRCEGAASPSAG
jgi:alkanesulfonate monooxygenase SsuD/methylene tetrahydromethanopterin reductase-like flavin-dependent oxidoreductase (luciferase family)